MSYSIFIGNAEVESGMEDGRYWADWEVKVIGKKDAPHFTGDEMTSNSNARFSGYGQWTEFCREVGLYEIFFDKEIGLMSEHPGCFLLTEEHLNAFKVALEIREKDDKRPAGLDPRMIDDDFVDIPREEQTQDYNKVRLKWLIYWTEWALKNCKNPAIKNR